MGAAPSRRELEAAHCWEADDRVPRRLDLGDGTQGIVGVDTNYHERSKPETPKPGNLWRYLQVAERSGVFAEGALDAVKGRSELAEMWLEHLLLLSMLQHQSGRWTWAATSSSTPPATPTSPRRAPATGPCSQTSRPSTFSCVTVEELLDAGVLPPPTVAALRDRYLPG